MRRPNRVRRGLGRRARRAVSREEADVTEDWINELREPAALLEHERNPRTHSPQQVAQLVDSIREWGFTNPVLIDQDNRIIAGHARTMAARELGLKAVPVRVRSAERPLTEAQVLALIIADNQLALN